MEFLEGIPSLLYKYRDWSISFHKKILTDTEIYLSSADQLNDPSDCMIPFRYKKEELTPENLFIKLLETGRKTWPHLTEEELHQKCYDRQMSDDFKNPEHWKEFEKYFKAKLNREVGIFSLSKKNDNLLMWSHYANSHKGFCVGFDKFELFRSVNGLLGSVIYDNEFPETSLFNAGDNDVTDLIPLFLQKSKDWEYEDEYRLTKIGMARRKCTLSNEAIKEVILGCRMEHKQKMEIINLVKEKFKSAKIFEVKLSDVKFRLDLNPIL